MKTFTAPTIEVLKFDVEDIITTSVVEGNPDEDLLPPERD